MAKKKGIEGEMHQYREPNWLPLAMVAGKDLLDDFMWMHEVRLSDDRRLHAYKHIDTRRYLHLDEECNAYWYGEDGRYLSAPLWAVLRAAVCLLWEEELHSARGAPNRARRALDVVFSRDDDADRLIGRDRAMT